MKKGKLIVLDGPDGSGKGTQAKLLVEHLKKENIRTEIIDFPRYSTFFGQAIGKYLMGSFGDPMTVSPYLSSLLYANDRLDASSTVKKWLNEGSVVVANRYVSSNAAHQGARLIPSDRKEYIKWLNELEYEINGIPREDGIIYLNIPVSISQDLILKKDKRNYTNGSTHDLHERNVEYLSKVAKVYKDIVEKSSTGYQVQCYLNNKLLSPEEIHAKVWKIILNLIS